MDLFEAIKDRRSVRAFKSTPIPEESLVRILEAASWAPSTISWRGESWEFIVVKDPALRTELYRAASDQAFIREAPVCIVVCVDQIRYSEVYGSRGTELYAICDASAATENLLLAVHALGLGACWVGDFNDTVVSRLLGLPSSVKPIAILPVGYPDETPSPKPRRHLKDAVHIEKYGMHAELQ